MLPLRAGAKSRSRARGRNLSVFPFESAAQLPLSGLAKTLICRDFNSFRKASTGCCLELRDRIELVERAGERVGEGSTWSVPRIPDIGARNRAGGLPATGSLGSRGRRR